MADEEAPAGVETKFTLALDREKRKKEKLFSFPLVIVARAPCSQRARQLQGPEMQGQDR